MPPAWAPGAPSRRPDAKGFIGNATDATAHYFGQPSGLGTMPHALIGYAGSTLRAAEMFHEAFPDDPLTSWSTISAARSPTRWRSASGFPDLAAPAGWSIRLDTHGGRFVEGLDVAAPTPCSSDTRRRRSAPTAREEELRWLTGTGVTAAAIFWHRASAWTLPASEAVQIIASSGFSPPSAS